MGIGQFDLAEFSEAPRDHIPDEWARRGPCPICSTPNTLEVKHLPEVPDQFVCDECGTAFEIQSKGSKIRVMVMSEALKPAWMEIVNRWMDPPEIQKLFKRYTSAQLDELSDEEQMIIFEPELTDREVMYQALELQRLGNDHETIKLLLLQAGATPQQAAGAVNRIKKTAEKESRKRSCFLWAMGGAAILVLGLILGVLWITSTSSANQTASETQVNSNSLFSQFDLGEVMTELMGIPTPQVIQTGPGSSNCPITAAQAAALFGGEESFWTKERGVSAWGMMNTGAPISVRIPANMFAGYMKMDSMDMISIQGPATINNINFIIISCE